MCYSCQGSVVYDEEGKVGGNLLFRCFFLSLSTPPYILLFRKPFKFIWSFNGAPRRAERRSPLLPFSQPSSRVPFVYITYNDSFRPTRGSKYLKCGIFHSNDELTMKNFPLEQRQRRAAAKNLKFQALLIFSRTKRVFVLMARMTENIVLYATNDDD